MGSIEYTKMSKAIERLRDMPENDDLQRYFLNTTFSLALLLQ